MRKNTFRWLVLAVQARLGSISVMLAQAGDSTPAYLDAKRPIEERVDDLIGRMTLKEKVGQLNLPCVYVDELGRRFRRSKRRASDSLPERTRRKSVRHAGFSRSPTRFSRKARASRRSTSTSFRRLRSPRRA